MKPIVWSEKMSVGINSFNEEHKHLINFINKLNNALEIRSTQNTMEEILVGLVDYTKIHFKHEEDAMLKYDYPDYTKHKKEHDSLTSQASELHERLKAGKTSFSLELMDFLSDWLTNHIQKTDMNYKIFFQGKI